MNSYIYIYGLYQTGLQTEVQVVQDQLPDDEKVKNLVVVKSLGLEKLLVFSLCQNLEKVWFNTAKRQRYLPVRVRRSRHKGKKKKTSSLSFYVSCSQRVWPRFRVGPPIFSGLIKTIPHRCAQNLGFYFIPDGIRLTTEASHHRWIMEYCFPHSEI